MRRSSARLSVETSPKNRDAGGPKRSSSSCESFIEKKNFFTAATQTHSPAGRLSNPLAGSLHVPLCRHGEQRHFLLLLQPRFVCKLPHFLEHFRQTRARERERERDATRQAAERRRASALISLLLCTCLPSHWPHAHTRTHARTGSIHALNARWRLRED